MQVNQLPGAAAFASKTELVSASHVLPFLPQSFRFPEHLEQFRNASSSNPEAEWLVKGGMHRGVRFVSSEAQAQESIDKESESFVQQLIRPYLIDGCGLLVALRIYCLSALQSLRQGTHRYLAGIPRHACCMYAGASAAQMPRARTQQLLIWSCRQKLQRPY